jgi:ribose/xylose/arabinose/galactoside ABC-type transport system permease subunit/ABC-type sugar transport system substrate-binding protein
MDRRTFSGLIAATAVTRGFGANRQPRKIALLFDSLLSPFWTVSLDLMREEASKRGWSVFEAVSNTDDARQYQQVQSVIQRGVDGIIIVHTDDKAVLPAIRLANKANVPMVHFNRPPAANDAYSVAVVADNRKIMRETVEALMGVARQRGREFKAALLIGDLRDANAVQRRAGIQDALKQNTDIVEVVAQVATEWNADKAFTGLLNALQARPDINLLVSSSDFLAPQIEQALKTAGKWKKSDQPGHVLIASFDGDANAYAQLADGYFDCDGVQNLSYEVALSFDALERLWNGEKLPKVLVDTGLVILRENLQKKRDQMWGYSVWKSESNRLKQATVGGLGSENSAGGVPAADTTSASVAHSAAPGLKSGVSSWTLAGLLIAFASFAHALFSVETLGDVLLAALPLAILVIGQTVVMLVGQIDLSMTAVMALGSVASASVMTRFAEGLGEPLVTLSGIVSCLALGLLIGLFNGACNAVLRIPSFIVTLAVMTFGSGAAVWYASATSDTVSIGGLPPAFRTIGYGSLFGIPIAGMLCALVALIAWQALAQTIIGRWIYAVGHNTRAARVSGVPVERITILAFAASGFCAALASVIYTSRIETGLPTLGESMLLDIVGAAVIGGISLSGGRGNVLMALGGVLFLCVLDKSLQLLGLSQFLVLAIKGGAILCAALLDFLRRRERRR